MKKPFPLSLHGLFLLTLLFIGWHNVNAESLALPSAKPQADRPTITPTPPSLPGKAYILIDNDSGKILAEKNSHQRVAPASLTKMMTMYVISQALRDGQIKMTDNVHISTNAWKTGGSRMFVKEGQEVKASDLIQGIITVSGNDACVAMAEHIAGSEAAFAELMNHHAKQLGMTESHFVDSTGMPNANHYTTAHDLAILASAIVRNFPEDYSWYKQKWFTWNGIRQPNRNRLLWRDAAVDGLKTGHTDEAGYCLVASAKENNMRLISVVMGAESANAREDASESLIRYGFRFYQTQKLYSAGQKLGEARVWKASQKFSGVGIKQDLFLTIGKSDYKQMKATLKFTPGLTAPIKKGQEIGELILTSGSKTIHQQPLIALDDNPKGGIWTRITDSVKLTVHRWFGDDESKS